MPRVQRRKAVRRRPLARKRYQRRKKMGLKKVVAAGLGFPQRMIVRLKYCDVIDDQLPITSLYSYRYCANGLYDPDITGTGHQPMYFDQYMALYDHYTVLGSKITCQVGYQTSGNANPVAGMCIMSNDSTTTTPGSISGIQEQSQVSNYVSLDPFNFKTISKRFSAKRTFGGNVMSRDELRGSAAANPAEDWYFDIKGQTLTAGSNAKVHINVRIDYIVCFSELKSGIGQS